MNNKSISNSKAPFSFILIFLLMTVGIIISGYLYYKNEREHITKTKFEELSAISDLKATRIANWKKEHMRNARDIYDSHLFAKLVQDYIKKPDAGPKKEITDRLTSLKENNQYQKVILADTNGKILFSTDSTDKEIEEHSLELGIESMQTRQVIFHNFHRGNDPEDVHLSIITPLIAHFGERNDVSGFLVFYIDPHQFLYPLIQSWPAPSKTAEALLIRQEGSEVVFLNELRHKKDTPLSLRFPLSKKDLPAAMAALGQEGIVEGLDYRGMPVLASIKPIPDSPWKLVAKVDASEIFAPIRKSAFTVTLFVLIMVSSSGLCIGLLWRHQRVEHYRRQYEAEVRHNSLLQRYEYLSRHANDIIIQLDLQGNLIDANERASQSYGYTHEELTHMNIRDLRQPETLDSVENDFKKVNESNGYIFETTHKKKDGTIFPVEVSSRLIAADHMKAYVSIIRDITERKENERSLKKSEENFRDLSHQFNALLDAIPDEITLLSPDLKIIWANKIAADKLGRKTSVYNQESCYKLRHGLSAPCADCPVLRTVATGNTENETLTTAKGRIWDMRTSPLFDSQGKVSSVINIARDITEHRRLEDQLRHAQKLEGVGQLAGGIAHDFNNILSAILGYASLLQMKMERDNPLRLNVEQILSAVDRASVLTHSLLAFSRKQIIDLRPVELNSIIRGIEKLLLRIIGEDIELKTELSEGRLTILADSGQMDQVLMNLATNSRDAMPDGGMILIETDWVDINEDFIRIHGYGKTGAYARISFTDTGAGIDEITMEKIFEPFFTTKEVGKGTGLGLSMAFGIIKQHFGFINCYSEPGKGTTFRIYLPLIASGVEEAGTAPVQSALHLPRGKETVLIAEDDESLRKLTRTVLKEFGYTVIEAADGDEAVRKFLENKDSIELLMLDIVMPKRNGKETYEEIRKIRPDIKVIFASGYTANLIHKKGILDTGLDFVMKPVSPLELLRKVREVLDR